ncbi:MULTISPECIES: CBO0543 family protein [Bacillaceae]|uniref:CBO0543 family protein n=1 Tax=Bacillaceae TaxID=186817 RepID=UPI002FFEA1A4
MNTVKHLNGSKLPQLPKKRLTFWNKNYVVCAIIATFIATYLDHYFVTKGIYEFPFRPFPELFSFNIGFTGIILPLFIIVFLHILSQVNNWGKAGIILLISLLVPIFEKLSEEFGLFIHSENWQHSYSIYGYLLFLMFIYALSRFLNKIQKAEA